MYFQPITIHFWRFLATFGLFQGIAGYSRLRFRHIRQYPSMSSHFLLFPSHYMNFLIFSTNSHPFLAICCHFLTIPGYSRQLQSIPGFSQIFQAFPRYSGLFQPISVYSVYSAHFHLFCITGCGSASLKLCTRKAASP